LHNEFIDNILKHLKIDIIIINRLFLNSGFIRGDIIGLCTICKNSNIFAYKFNADIPIDSIRSELLLIKFGTYEKCKEVKQFFSGK
jgi:hypothetical protein